jgi:hypothetical protein
MNNAIKQEINILLELIISRWSWCIVPEVNGHNSILNTNANKATNKVNLPSIKLQLAID